MGFQDESVAIIGMAGRFPGARNIDEFQRNLAAGVESVTFLGEAELRAAGVPEQLIANPDYVRAALLLDDYDCFDETFFDVSPGEAALMDPQHRIFLETCWRALEDGGQAGHAAGSNTGVFAGSGGMMMTYLLSEHHLRRELVTGTAGPGHVGNDKDYVATRVSYRLDLRGPAFTVQTACSTSLVALHLACRSIQSGECDMALAGGVTIRVPHAVGYLSQEESVFSPDGHCRAFDAKARGTLFGSGAGAVLLKPLRAALDDGDEVYAIIRGTAINNDGAGKQSYWASSAEGLERAMRQAQARCGVSPDSIGYVETHGTGTILGDPVEVFAMNRAFRAFTKRTGYCAIGSVKTNIGHLEAAAGIAGLIKTVLALRNQTIPPSLHYETPNPHIRFDRSPFFVAAEALPFESQMAGEPARAAVNSMGIGGTNAHVILEAAPETKYARGTPAPVQVLTVSAKTPEALSELRAGYLGRLRETSDAGFAGLCRTAGAGRAHFEERAALAARSREEAIDRLESGPGAASWQGRVAVEAEDRPGVALLFGDGSKTGDLKKTFESLATFPAFQQALKTIEPLLAEVVEQPLYEILKHSGDFVHAILGIAMVETMEGLGLGSRAVYGDGIGQFAAARAAGKLSSRDALGLAALWGQDETAFAEQLAATKFSSDKSVFYNDPLLNARENTDGKISDDPARPEFWGAAHALSSGTVPRRDVASFEGVRNALREEGCPVFVAAGPGVEFGVMEPDDPATESDEVYISFPAQEHEFAGLVARLYVLGVDIDWSCWQGRDALPAMVKLPGHPLVARRHWIEAGPLGAGEDNQTNGSGASPAVALEPAPVVFCYSGQGGLWAGMTEDLLREADSRRMLEACNEAFASYLPAPLMDTLRASELTETVPEVQAMTFAMQLALTARWTSRGQRPDIVIGQSIGEIAAAHTAGVLSLEDAVSVVHHRSTLMVPIGGSMAMVELSAADLERELAPGTPFAGLIGIASHNGATTCAISGAETSVAEFLVGLRQREIYCKEIDTSTAGHGPLLDPILPELRARLAHVRPVPANCVLYSTVTGRRETGADSNGDYWASNVRQPVLFWPALQEIGADPVFVEISPHPIVLSSIRKGFPGVRAFPSMLRDDPGVFQESFASVRRERTAGALSAIQAAARGQAGDGPPPFKGRRMQSAVDGSVYREMELGTDEIPWVLDHQVQQNIILPGTAFIEMACSAWREDVGEITPERPLELRDIRFHRGLFFDRDPERKQQVQTTLSGQGDERSFTVHGRGRGEESFVLHASATLGFMEPAPLERLEIEVLQERLKERRESGEFYAAFAREGVAWGPAFQGHGTLYRAEGEALRQVEVNTGDDFFLHPALLDVCVQSMNVADLPAGPLEAPGAFLFHGVERFAVYERPRGPVWCYARRRPDRTDETFRAFDFIAAAQDGRIVAECQGIAIQYIETENLRLRDWLYEVVFEDVTAAVSGAHVPTDWLILCDEAGVGTRLAGEMVARGYRPLLVHRGEAYAGWSGGAFRVNPSNPEDLTRLLAEAPDRAYGIACLWGLDGAHREAEASPVEPALDHSVAVVHLTQALAASQKQHRLFLATAGAQAPHGAAMRLAGAPLWGLARTVAEEHQELWGGITDLDPRRDESGLAHDLFQAWMEAPAAESMTIARDGRRLAPRLSRRDFPEADKDRGLDPEGSYLITGGFGDLGLLAAERLIQRGARRVALLGRTAPVAGNGTGYKLEAIARMRAAGATVDLFTVDVGDEDALRSILERIESAAPLRGIVHAAGVNRPGALSEWTAAEIRADLRAKVDGAWHLHRHTRDLDFFVLYSSMASLMNSPLIGVYAAANAFLDGLAHFRAARGEPALALHWGYWGEVGMATRRYDNSSGGSLDSRGMIAMDPGDCLYCLDQFMESPATEVCVVAADWQEWARYHPGGARHPFLGRVVRVESDDEEMPDPASRLFNTSGQIRLNRLDDYLKGAAGGVLRVEAGSIQSEKGLSRMGLDSMMALELKRKILGDLGVNIPIATFLRDLSVNQIGQEIARLLGRETTVEESVEPIPGESVASAVDSLEAPGSAPGPFAFAATPAHVGTPPAKVRALDPVIQQAAKPGAIVSDPQGDGKASEPRSELQRIAERNALLSRSDELLARLDGMSQAEIEAALERLSDTVQS